MLNQHQTIRDNIAKFNKLNPLVSYLTPFIKGKKEVSIADIGSGPLNTIGQMYSGVQVKVLCSDNQDFTEFYKKYDIFPLYPITYQDMEKLTYPNDTFDIVHSVNALDHTKSAEQAVKEMIRVCKPGGTVYIECNLYQMDTGHKHFWNAKEDGTFENSNMKFNLKDLGFTVEYIDKGGEVRYNQIIAILKK